MYSPMVLDVTLRDGGCVNDFNFGNHYMHTILNAIEGTGIQFIELGYLDNVKGSLTGRTQFCNEHVIEKLLLRNRKAETTYLAMIDYGKFDVEKLSNRSPFGIDGIRLAFHKKDRKAMLAVGRAILDKGYKLFVQPMLTLHYSDNELKDLLDDVNKVLHDATAIYIVDSFGEMHEPDLMRIAKYYVENIPMSMAIGFHSHNNLQLSYALALSLINAEFNRQIIVDSSLSGMGKGAGNLCTELLIGYLNQTRGDVYNIRSALAVIDQVINVLRQETPWGYSIEYYLSSRNHCSPSYASYFYNKQMLSVDQVEELLSKIDVAKRISFDCCYAESLYYSYKTETKFNDDHSVNALRKCIAGKTVLIIAPGKSINTSRDSIIKMIDNSDIVSIGLNNVEFSTSFTLITRPELFTSDYLGGHPTIVTSRITTKTSDNVYVLDYHSWTLKRDKVYDSSAVVSLLLAAKLRAKKIILAGFDGFSADVNGNYFDEQMRRPTLPKSISDRNKFNKWLIEEIAKNTPVSFATKSKYQ